MILEMVADQLAAVVTVEKAAATKIFFECHYNELFSTPVTPRSIRRRELEGALYEDVTMSPIDRETNVELGLVVNLITYVRFAR
jgi:hypothetical protein